MRRPLPALLIFSIMFFVTPAMSGQDRWQLAEASIVRLSPAAFSHLPPHIIRHLRARGCAIPQSFGRSEPHNVISGEFASRGQMDWAVLCSRNGASSILVFWGGSTRRVAEIAASPDSAFLQTIDENGNIGYSRAISAVGRDYIRAHYREYGGRRPPRLEHQGINDAFVEKASVVHYYHRGRWLELQGAD